MSGPVSAVDAQPDGPRAEPGTGGPPVELLTSRATAVGGVTVRRALPKRERRTVGAWCFVDHFGPTAPGAGAGMQIGPHPHIGLQTVTWLVEGELLHRDSVGSEQTIRPGQLNLMTAGHGVAHAEESTAPARVLHGAQLWVAQPDATRDGAPAFEHHAELPATELGPCEVTVLIGAVAGTRSPARADTALVGAELTLPAGGRATVPLDPAFEHAVVVLEGGLEVGEANVEPGTLAYLGRGRDELPVVARGPGRALLLGGEPFDEDVLMWWNFVARARAEVEEATADWEAGASRFGAVPSALPRMPAPPPRWTAR